jgi:hypothetical protein
MKIRLLIITLLALSGCKRIDPDKISMTPNFKSEPCDKKDKGRLAVDATGHMFACGGDKWDNVDALPVGVPADGLSPEESGGKCLAYVGARPFVVDCAKK